MKNTISEDPLILNCSNTFSYPTVAGSYTINKGFVINFAKKPKLIHRIFTKLLLGWEWEDEG